MSGKAAACVVTPEDDGLRRIGGMVAAFVHEIHRVDLPVYTVEEHRTAYRSRKRNIIALGDSVTNALLARLRALGRHYTGPDFPGGDGYVVRTVMDAEGDGRSYIILGGSTESAIQAAADAFCEAFLEVQPGRAMPFTSIFISDEPREPASRRDLETRVHGARARLRNGLSQVALGGDALEAARLCDVYGDGRMGRVFAQIVLDYGAAVEAMGTPTLDESFDPGPWLHRLLAHWDNIEESGAFAADERDRICEALLAIAQILGREAAVEASIGAEVQPASSEDLAMALSLAESGRYFGTNYNLGAARRWQAIADIRVRAALAAGRPLGDSAAEDATAIDLMAEYVLRRGVPELSLAPEAVAGFRQRVEVAAGGADVERAAAAVSLALGKLAFLRGEPSSPAEAARPAGQDEVPPPPAPEHRRPRALTVARLPAELVGWARGNWARGRHGPEPADPFFERAFDRVALRASVAGSVAHAVLSGFGAARTGPSSAGALLGLALGSVPILRGPAETADAAYPLNAVELARDGRYIPPPMVSSLEGAMSVGGTVAVSVTVPGYNGARWRRHAFLLSLTALLLVDEVEADLAGNYDMMAHLHTARPVTVSESRAMVRRSRYSVDLSALGGQPWQVFSEGEDHIALMASPSLGVSESFCLGVSVVLAAGPGPPSVRAEPVSESAFRVHGLARGPAAVVIVGDGGDLPECMAQARSLILFGDLIAVVGATRFAAASSYVESSDPVDLIIRPAEGRVFVTSHTGSQVFLGFGHSRTEVELRPGQRWEHDILLPPTLGETMLERVSRPSDGAVPRRASHARSAARRAPAGGVSARPLLSIAAEGPVAAGLNDYGLVLALRSARLEVHRAAGSGASFALVSRPTCLATGPPGIVVGGESGAVQCFASGAETWRYSGLAYREAPHVTALATYPSPGGPGVLVGTSGGAVCALDERGLVLWAADQAAEAVSGLQVVGRSGAEWPSAGICTTAHCVRVFDLSTGARKCSLLSPGARVTGAHLCSAPNGADLVLVTRSDGRVDALSVGAIVAADYARLQCSPQWSVELASRPTNALALLTDGSETLAVACEAGWLAWIAPTGAVLRRDRLAPRPMALATCGLGLIAVTRDGDVLTLDPDGAVTGSFSLGAAPSACVPLSDGMVVVLPSAVVHVGQPGSREDNASR